MCDTAAEAELILTPTARRYLSGFAADDGYILLSGDRKILFADGRYYEEAARKLPDIEVVCLTNARRQLSETLEELGVEKVSVETDITVEQVEDLRTMLPGIEIIPNRKLSESIREMRAVKSDEELESIKKAQHIAERAFEHILRFIRVGVSEKQIAAELEYAMRKAGSERAAFDTIAVSGTRTSLPHGEPTYKTVAPGEFITMDFGAVVNGYHSDMTRTVAVGDVGDAARKVYETVLEAQTKALAAVKAGAALSSVDGAARSVIKAAGFGKYFCHSAGHGVGLEIHEKPSVSPRAEGILSAGNVITVEPGIYIPEKFGVRIEDMVFVTADGCENLTSAEKSLIVLR